MCCDSSNTCRKAAGTSLQLRLEELCHLTHEMVACIGSVDAVVTVGIEQFLEVLVGLYQCL